MEYAASVWDPYQEIDIQAIEKVQRRDYNRTSSISNMLETLKWLTPESRRKISRL